MFITTLLSKYLAKRAKVNSVGKLKSKSESAAPTLLKQREVQAVDDPSDKNAEWAQPLTAEQAESVLFNLRKSASLLSPWRLIVWQFLVGIVISLIAFLALRDGIVAVSVAYGSLASVLPAMVFVWVFTKQRKPEQAMAAGLRFFVLEAVKVGLTVTMLVAAPVLIADVNWLALLAGFVITMKVYWVAIWLYPVRKNLA